MVRRASAFVLLAALLVGCSGDGGEISEQELPRLVVLRADLPAGYERFDEGRLVSSDAPRGDGGWKARYRSRGGPDSSGPLVVDSRVDVYEDAEAARAGLDSYREDVPPSAESLADPELGEGAYAATALQKGVARGVRFFFIGWRRGAATATLSVSGFEGRVGLGDALALARSQAERIDAAL